MYFFAKRSMPSSAPSVVKVTTVPRTVMVAYGSSGSVSDTATRASVARLRALARPSAVLMTMSSPSSSTHTGLTLGAPSGSRLATCASTGFSKTAREAGVKVSGTEFLSSVRNGLLVLL